MKKFLIILTSLLLIFSLTACINDESVDSNPNVETETEKPDGNTNNDSNTEEPQDEDQNETPEENKISLQVVLDFLNSTEVNYSTITSVDILERNGMVDVLYKVYEIKVIGEVTYCKEYFYACFDYDVVGFPSGSDLIYDEEGNKMFSKYEIEESDFSSMITSFTVDDFTLDENTYVLTNEAKIKSYNSVYKITLNKTLEESIIEFESNGITTRLIDINSTILT